MTASTKELPVAKIEVLRGDTWDAAEVISYDLVEGRHELFSAEQFARMQAERDHWKEQAKITALRNCALQEQVKMLRSAAEQVIDDLGEVGTFINHRRAKQDLVEALAATEPKEKAE